MQIHSVQGGGGLNLHVREWGKADAPAILFLHGWSQHHLCWARQTASALAHEFRLVAPDLRGHGQSEAPLESDAYTQGSLWADDVHNVIQVLGLGRPVLVGWSYGGLMIGDYLRVHGDDGIAGVNFVGAAVGIGKSWIGTHIGNDFAKRIPPACSDDQPTALRTIREIVHLFFARPLDTSDMEMAIGWSALVHPAVRLALMRRTEDFTPELAKLTRPVLTSYGEKDVFTLPVMAQTIHAHVQDGTLSVYPEAGHAPFLEDPDRFNAELAAFARRCFGAG